MIYGSNAYDGRVRFHIHAKPGIEAVFHYWFRPSNNQRTQITQTIVLLVKIYHDREDSVTRHLCRL